MDRMITKKRAEKVKIMIQDLVDIFNLLLPNYVSDWRKYLVFSKWDPIAQGNIDFALRLLGLIIEIVIIETGLVRVFSEHSTLLRRMPQNLIIQQYYSCKVRVQGTVAVMFVCRIFFITIWSTSLHSKQPTHSFLRSSYGHTTGELVCFIIPYQGMRFEKKLTFFIDERFGRKSQIFYTTTTTIKILSPKWHFLQWSVNQRRNQNQWFRTSWADKKNEPFWCKGHTKKISYALVPFFATENHRKR